MSKSGVSATQANTASGSLTDQKTVLLKSLQLAFLNPFRLQPLYSCSTSKGPSYSRGDNDINVVTYKVIVAGRCCSGLQVMSNAETALSHLVRFQLQVRGEWSYSIWQHFICSNYLQMYPWVWYIEA